MQIHYLKNKFDPSITNTLYFSMYLLPETVRISVSIRKKALTGLVMMVALCELRKY